MFSIAIDGPAGAGKSTIAKELAKRLDFIYVDTGALYRTVAVQLLNENIDPKDEKSVMKSLENIVVTMEHMEDGQHMFLCGEDVTTKIRMPEVSMMASTSSALPCVRTFLFGLQTKMAEQYNVVMDGRDIGTVVLPNANVKVFLTASPEVRAKRRLIDLGDTAVYEEVLADIIKRDHQDSTRAIAPLKQADDADLIDSSDLSFEEVIEKFLEIVRNKK